MDLVQHFGNKVQGKKGEVDVCSLADSKAVIGIYFSAHWCPPCRGFTPVLGDWYEDNKDNDDGIKLEIVFVSSDKDEEQFNEYYATMDWCALPFSDRDRKGKLATKYNIRGIPSLVFVNGKGELITNEGRKFVQAGTKVSKIK